MQPRFLFLLALLAFAAPLAAQSADTTVNAAAREQYAAVFERARAAAAQNTAESLIAAGEAYLEARQIAAASGDSELTPLTAGSTDAAIRSFTDAGTRYFEAQQYEPANTQFQRAAGLAREAGNMDALKAILFNAGGRFQQADQPAFAIPMLEQGIAIDSTNFVARFNYALALNEANRQADAQRTLQSLDRSATAAGDSVMAGRARTAIGRGMLGQAQNQIRENNFNQAISTLDQAAPYLGPDDNTLNSLYANAYYRQGVAQVRGVTPAATGLTSAQRTTLTNAQRTLTTAQDYARRANRDQIVSGAQQQLDYIQRLLQPAQGGR